MPGGNNLPSRGTSMKLCVLGSEEPLPPERGPMWLEGAQLGEGEQVPRAGQYITLR